VTLFPDYVRRSISQASGAIQEYQAIQRQNGSIEIRLVLDADTDHSIIERDIRKNLDYWCQRIDGKIGELRFEYRSPELHPISKKMIRVWRVND